MSLFIRLIAAALLLAGASAAPAQEQFGEWDMTVEQMQQAVQRLREEMFQPGERVSGWDRGGANPDADLRAAGADSHFMRSRGANGDGIIILTDRAIASFAPSAWRVADTYGSASTAVDNGFVQFEALSPRYVIGMRGGSERRRDTDCTDGIVNATLYERPDVPHSDADDSIRLIFRLVLLAAEGQTVCTRYEGNAREGYRGLAFLPDGRSLPRLNDDHDLNTIIPAGPIEQLVTFTGRGNAT